MKTRGRSLGVGGSSSSLTSRLQTILILVLLNILCFQVGRQSVGLLEERKEEVDVRNPNLGEHDNDILSVPRGHVVNLPSLRVKEEDGNVNNSNSNNKIDRKIYGGKGDKKHLGGFTEIDINGLSPMVWTKLVEEYGIRSIMDVGCGRGISTSWFVVNGLDTVCIEGSHDAVLQTMLPDPPRQVVEHDYARGPWWPDKTYDAVWCVEFLEHVGRQFHKNYLPTFRKAAIIFATHAIWGGWHHVETHRSDWWIQKMELYGFRYNPEMSESVRRLANREPFVGRRAPNGANPNPQNLYRMLVFINPAVAALPEHGHLMAEAGCFGTYEGGNLTTRDCVESAEESALPESFKPLKVTLENQIKWEERVKSFLKRQP